MTALGRSSYGDWLGQEIARDITDTPYPTRADTARWWADQPTRLARRLGIEEQTA